MKRKKKKSGPISKLAHPILAIGEKVHKLRKRHHCGFVKFILHRKIVSCTIGLTIMFFGAYIYHHHPPPASEEFWEMSAFGIHGFGAAPIIKLLADIIGFEV